MKVKGELPGFRAACILSAALILSSTQVEASMSLAQKSRLLQDSYASYFSNLDVFAEPSQSPASAKENAK